MPNENDNNDLSDLSIDEINDLYSDIIEFPDDNRISIYVKVNICDQDPGCGSCAPRYGGGGK